MEIFLDSADLSLIEKYCDFIDGVTTNPSILAKGGVTDVRKRISDIGKLVSGQVSAEVISDTYDEMVKEGKELSEIHHNVCAKLPCTFDGLRTCKTLSQKGIRTNVTLCFSATQAVLAAKCGATYISPFIGRIDDLGRDGLNLIEEIVDIYAVQEFETKVLAASVRTVNHFIQVAQIGVDAITLPADLLEKSFHHPLTDIGLEKFMSDWSSTNSKKKK